jgi:excinuclease ABC subunit A
MVLATGRRGAQGRVQHAARRAGGPGLLAGARRRHVIELAERESLTLARYEQHTIDVVLDRLTCQGSNRQRLTESVEAALKLTAGWSRSSSSTPTSRCSSPRTWPAPTAASASPSWRPGTSPSTRPTAPARSAPGSAPASRSTPTWWCPTTRCRSPRARWRRGPAQRFKYFERLIDGIAELGGLRRRHAVEEAAAKDRKLILYGVEKRSVPVKYRNRYGKVRTYDTTYNGIVDWLERKRNEADGDWSREQAEQYMREVECHACAGPAPQARVLAVRSTGTTSPR